MILLKFQHTVFPYVNHLVHATQISAPVSAQFRVGCTQRVAGLHYLHELPKHVRLDAVRPQLEQFPLVFLG